MNFTMPMTEPASTSATSARPIRVRAMGFTFDDSIPRWWFFDNAIATHVANGVNLLFPDGERFFIRSVKHYMPLIEKDPELHARVKAFFGQEGRHGHEHERTNRIFEAQGYEVEPFLKWYRELGYGRLEKLVPPVVRLSITAALEHFTATMAENALKGDLMDNAHPKMRALLKWHAAEEIEHKSVAFDVLQKVDPSWLMRATGLFLGTGVLFFFWAAGTQELLRQEEERGIKVNEQRYRATKIPRLIAESKHRKEMYRRAFVDYLRRDFHPDQNDNYHLAVEYLTSVGRLDS